MVGINYEALADEIAVELRLRKKGFKEIALSVLRQNGINGDLRKHFSMLGTVLQQRRKNYSQQKKNSTPEESNGFADNIDSQKLRDMQHLADERRDDLLDY